MSEFHFIRPLWLVAIIALLIALYLLKKVRIKQSGWQQLVPEHLAKVIIHGEQSSKPLSLVWPFIIGMLAITALAGPSWQKLPQPVYQVARGSVVVMDMSYSMYATDLTPNRLTRARYKATDLLDNLNEGEIGLIAYAGDAFVISPLTDDINNIKLLLPSLTPDIMPELGSNPFAALTLAHEMLANAGHVEGDIYWFTDGIDNEDIQDLTEWSRAHPHHLNILGIGTQNGAPIKLTNGELMKDNSGAIVIPKLPEDALYGVAKRGRGTYRTISNDFTDINDLVERPLSQESEQESAQLSTGDQWQEAGPYLVLLLLPIVLMYFRRGTVLAFIPLTFLLTPVEQAHASLWQDLWKTDNQQAQQKFNQEAYDEAAKQFKDSQWQGSAHYRAGNYEQALEAYKKEDSINSWYNQGNTLAKLQQLDQAIAAYDKVLEKEPTHKDALANKALLEQLKQQQNQENQQDQNNDQNQDQQGEQNQQDQQGQQNGDQNQNQDPSDQQQQNQQGQENQQDEQNSSNEQQSDQQQSENNAGQDAENENKPNDENQQQEQQNNESSAEEGAENQAEEQSANAKQAQLTQDKLDQETEQKHQQLLNKVTDDPYLLLRNKMQIEYQKRRQNQNSIGVKKKW